MKPSNSEITTRPKAASSKIGTLLGGHGLETLESLPAHVPPETVEDITRSWPDLLHTPLASTIERDALERALGLLSTPAPGKWITGRIASLLAQYYQGDISESMMKAIADDWRHELQDYPAWAIAKAVRWWTGRENQDRRKKPLPGDIADRAQKEMGPLLVAGSAIRRFDAGLTALPAPEPSERISKERAAEIMAEVGFGLRKMDQD